MQNILDFIKKLLSWFATTKAPTSNVTDSDKKESNKPDKPTTTNNSTTSNKIKTKEMAEKSSGTLYALCVGINDYQYVPKLGGCVPDATNVYNYLKSTCANTDFKFDAVILTDSDATKANVVKNFQEHLGKAKKGDVAVFYFSGHGAEEGADEVFWSASQKKTLNTLVCYDSRSPEGITDLADKELRYLINGITYSEDENPDLPHFVLITDSCHSGSVTRDSEAVPRLTEKGKSRDWDKFIFKDKLSRADFANAQSLKAILPQGQHIHFSSCQGTELAYEVRGSGVFTSTMLEVLNRTSGKVTYSDLHSRIRNYIKGRFPQSPTIHSIKGDKGESVVNPMEQYFLGGASEKKGLTFNVGFNTKERKWSVSMGALHGMPTDNFSNVEVTIMGHDDKPLTTAKVSSVQPDKSFIDIADEDKVDIRESYSGEVRGFYLSPVAFYLNESSDAAAMGKLKAALDNYDLEDANAKLVDSFAAASYAIRVEDNHYVISRVADTLHRPIVEQQKVDKNSTFDNMCKFIHAIGRYEFTSTIDNPKTKLEGKSPNQPPAGIEIYEASDPDDTKGKLLTPNENGEFVFDKESLIIIKTVNNTRRQKLNFALLYMDMTFGVDAAMLGDNSQEMLPEEVLPYDEGYPLDVSYDKFVLDFNYPESRMTLKLLASTAPFDATKLSQDALPAPLKDLGDSEDENYRALKRRSRPDADDWCVHTVHIVLKNPKGKDYDGKAVA